MTRAVGLAIVLLALFYVQVDGDDGWCVMEGPCHEGDYGNDLNCLERRPAKALPTEDREHYQTLKKMCPHLVQQGEESKLCCSAKQIEALESNNALANAILGRCPACFENFKKIFCEFTCSPNQDNFVWAGKVEQLGDLEIIKKVDYYVSKSFVEAIFESCVNVVGLMPGSTALELMCGIWGKECTVQRWLDFMGTDIENGGMAPFAIDFKITPDGELPKGFKPASSHAFKCSEPAGESKEACNCVDCKEACKI